MLVGTYLVLVTEADSYNITLDKDENIMKHNLNGQQTSFEEIEEAVVEGETPSLGIMLPPEPDEIVDIGEIDAKNWKDFQDIFTDSLWYFESRSRESVHTGSYHGNFVPQIPYQSIRRFTKPGDVVLDTFLGSGTTLIEARRLGRNGIGIELIDTVATEAEDRLQAANNPHETWQTVIQGDSTTEETINQVRQILAEQERDQVQLLIMHPPYHDIIKFSNDPRDLCNARTLTDFLESFKKIVYRTYDLLEQNHFLVVVVGDKYNDGEWIPLGFRTMEAAQSVGYTLKSIVVKNMEGNRAKRNLQNFWRQRAFRGNYYIFKHEYILFFQKTGKIAEYWKKITEFVTEIDAREDRSLIQRGSFVSGEALNELMIGNYWVLPPRILALKQGQLRAIVVNLADIKLTREVEDELENFIGKLPDSVIDVSVLAERKEKERLQNIPGVSQVYFPDDQSIELLAHALYNIRKATGSGQRAGRVAGVAFAAKLNKALEKYFELDADYEWRRHGAGIGFKFFKHDVSKPFDAMKNGFENFQIGIETKWGGSGHENEKAPQIHDNYYNKGFKLIAVIGHNIERWKATIQKRGNFADYYLFVSKEDEESLDEVILNRPLVKARGDREFEETEYTMLGLLKNKQPDLVTKHIQENE